ncbi:nuclear transport factor 2 family protein [Pontibacillus salipaludis]|uniref:DUF4440 domain-containing protein n=1 Tax=Pontibacillus salipaludis TaxID=1697394 RepID=A0ABQ1Q640_9BACI|nr:DUF4440 domain-containing protein [Pontibacillus salipaludis]GGD15280.1 hypothetical protein GCM10011389_23710 [Pontibacillus salipaludis]
MEDLYNHLKELEETLLQPETRKSLESLQNLLAPSFFEVGSSGEVLYKEGITTENIGVVDMTLFDFEIHPLSEEVVLTTFTIDNHLKQQRSLRSSIWKHMNGNWMMVFHQGTIAKETYKENRREL